MAFASLWRLAITFVLPRACKNVRSFYFDPGGRRWGISAGRSGTRAKNDNEKSDNGSCDRGVHGHRQWQEKIISGFAFSYFHYPPVFVHKLIAFGRLDRSHGKATAKTLAKEGNGQQLRGTLKAIHGDGSVFGFRCSMIAAL